MQNPVRMIQVLPQPTPQSVLLGDLVHFELILSNDPPDIYAFSHRSSIYQSDHSHLHLHLGHLADAFFQSDLQ